MTERQTFPNVLNPQLHQRFDTNSPRQFENSISGNIIQFCSPDGHGNLPAKLQGYVVKISRN